MGLTVEYTRMIFVVIIFEVKIVHFTLELYIEAREATGLEEHIDWNTGWNVRAA